jgi:SEL1 protein
MPAAYFQLANFYLGSILPYSTPTLDSMNDEDDWLLAVLDQITMDRASGGPSFLGQQHDHQLDNSLNKKEEDGTTTKQLSSLIVRSSIEPVKAMEYLERAAIGGHAGAKSLLSILESIVATMPRSEGAATTTSSSSLSSSAFSRKHIARAHLWMELAEGMSGVSSLSSFTPDTASKLLNGYSHMYGRVGSVMSCPASANYYHSASQSLIEKQIQNMTDPGPKVKLGQDMIRLEHEYNKAIGGKSSSGGANGGAGGEQNSEHDIIQYYQYYADTGDSDAQVTMGVIYLMGHEGVPRDYERAAHYFRLAAEPRPSSSSSRSKKQRDASSSSKEKEGDSIAKVYLGYMHQHGYGVTQDNRTALQYYRDAARAGNGYALAQLGRMYLHGWTVTASTSAALKYFTKAQEAQHPEGQLQLGLMYLNGIGVVRDYTKAQLMFSRAAQQGHLVALYNLAQMQHAGLGMARNCKNSVLLYKKVLETHILVPLAQRAYQYYTLGHTQHALLLYDILAALGFELAQSNAAWMYEMNIGQWWVVDHSNGNGGVSTSQQITEASEGTSEDDTSSPSPHYTARRALELFRDAAQQGSADAHLKLGDFYYSGVGTSENVNKSAACYWLASDMRHPQATFNLGWMYQRGAGSLPKDLHLAKRYYDLAATLSHDAYIPTRLAVLGLGIEYILDWPLLVDALRYADMSSVLATWDTALLLVLLGLLLIALGIRTWIAAWHAAAQQRAAPA